MIDIIIPILQTKKCGSESCSVSASISKTIRTQEGHSSLFYHEVSFLCASEESQHGVERTLSIMNKHRDRFIDIWIFLVSINKKVKNVWNTKIQRMEKEIQFIESVSGVGTHVPKIKTFALLISSYKGKRNIIYLMHTSHGSQRAWEIKNNNNFWYHQHHLQKYNEEGYFSNIIPSSPIWRNVSKTYSKSQTME